MAVEIHELRPVDCEKVVALWASADAAPLEEAGSADSIRTFLQKNPNLGLVARDGQDVVGAILCHRCDTEGRMHHLAVSRDYQDTGLADELVDRAVRKMVDRHRTTSRITIGTDAEQNEFWDQHLWRGVPDLRHLVEHHVERDPEDFQSIVTENPTVAGIHTSDEDRPDAVVDAAGESDARADDAQAEPATVDTSA